MAPGKVADYSNLTPKEFRTKLDIKADKSAFLDSVETTRQQPPVYELLRAYSDFPKQITGKTVWHRDDYLGSSEKESEWKHPFTDEQIKEMSTAADGFLKSGRPLTNTKKV